jgi:hypothetical protein
LPHTRALRYPVSSFTAVLAKGKSQTPTLNCTRGAAKTNDGSDVHFVAAAPKKDTYSILFCFIFIFIFIFFIGFV